MSAQSDFDEQLVRLWVQAAKEDQRSSWIAEEMHTTTKHVRNRADFLRRKMGVKLPHLAAGIGRSAHPLDADRLNAIIEKESK